MCVAASGRTSHLISNPEVRVGLEMERRERFVMRPLHHDLLNFVLSHLVLPERHVVDKESPAELVGD